MRWTERLWLVMCGAALLTGCLILYFFNPLDTKWMPKCMFFTLTGFKCPTCGALRAVHSLMHLDFKTAFMLNPMLPVLLAFVITIIYRELRPDQLSEGRSLKWLYGYIAIFCIWWVVRNVIGI